MTDCYIALFIQKHHRTFTDPAQLHKISVRGSFTEVLSTQYKMLQSSNRTEKFFKKPTGLGQEMNKKSNVNRK